MKGLASCLVKSFVIAAMIIAAAGCSKRVECSVPAHIKDGRIILESPSRAAGQSSALGMTAEALDTVRVGFIGLGMRGSGAIMRYTYIDGVRIVAVCDMIDSKIDQAVESLAARGVSGVATYGGEEGWKELCQRDDIDLVYICTPWKSHCEMAVYAMEHGKHVACEVPAAMSIEECWRLVDTCEKTRRHFMMLENCCYDFFEMTALNMAQQGLFGEILEAEGAYIHNLDPYWKDYEANWRLEYNQAHRGDNYPTHGIGPVCQALNIHRGDRLDYVVSVDTKTVHGLEVASENMGATEFADGDHTTSLIRTVSGKMIEIQHNVYARRPYSRLYQLCGTRGFAQKYPSSGLAVMSENLPDEPVFEGLDGESFVPAEVYERLMEDYKPEWVRPIEDYARMVGGHGGMDYIMDYRLVYCLRRGLPLDEDVYDAAEWCCLTELSGLSLSNGSIPVAVPDFTRGDWNKVNGFSYAF